MGTEGGTGGTGEQGGAGGTGEQGGTGGTGEQGGTGGTGEQGGAGSGGAAFDVSNLPPEVQSFIRQQVSKAEAKVRIGTKENAAKAAREQLAAELAKALGLGGQEGDDPNQIKAELAKVQGEAAQLRLERAAGRAARRAGADEDLVVAALAHRGELTKLTEGEGDPDVAADELVAALVKRYPTLAGPPTAAQPAGRTSSAALTGGARPNDGGTAGTDEVPDSVEGFRKLFRGGR
jgi:hypothetical protein